MTESVESRFWEQKTLAQMSDAEWESLCDGCGKCCLNKIIDDDTDELYFTEVGCALLDCDSGRCGDYYNRFERVSDCFKVTLADIDSWMWLPPSCAYRRLAEGRGLPSWHPLLNQGSQALMHRGGFSVRGKAFSEQKLQDSLVHYIAVWPLDDED